MVTLIEIDNALKNRVESLATLRQKSADSVMREAIAQYVEREEARESFKQETMESWAEYQQTGRHLTGEEVSAWLNTWGTEADAEPPECHTWSLPNEPGSAWRGAACSCLQGTDRLPGGPARSSIGNSHCCGQARTLGVPSLMCRVGVS